MTNHRKRTIDLLLLMASKRLDKSHIQLYINSMCNIMIIIIGRSIQKEKSVLRQQPHSMHNIKFQEKKISLTHYCNKGMNIRNEGMNSEYRCT